MYCKFCGGRITSDTTKCGKCGADIDLNDGGQSFYDDNELDAWKDEPVFENPTYMPKTEMRDEFTPMASMASMTPMSPAESRKGAGERNSMPTNKGQYPTYEFTSSADTNVRRRRKKKGFLRLSGSNRLIIFCIAVVLAFVLLTVSIIAVLRGRSKDETDEKSQQAVEAITDKSNNGAEGKEEITEFKIYDSDGKEVSHSCPLYIDKEYRLYVSIDKITKHLGYKDGAAKTNVLVIYEHSASKKKIEIQKYSKYIWVGDEKEKTNQYELEADSFNVENETYVPAKSFLSKIGYDENKISWDENTKTLYLKK